MSCTIGREMFSFLWAFTHHVSCACLSSIHLSGARSLSLSHSATLSHLYFSLSLPFSSSDLFLYYLSIYLSIIYHVSISTIH